MLSFKEVAQIKAAQKFKNGPAGVAQWIECQPMNQRVAGSIPGQGAWAKIYWVLIFICITSSSLYKEGIIIIPILGIKETKK